VKEGNAPNPTTATEVNQTESALPSDEKENAVLSDEQTETLLVTATCITEEDGTISCKLPNGFDFYFDGVTGQIFTGSSKKRASPPTAIIPEFQVSMPNSKGQLNIDFSEEVGFEELIDLGPQEERRLKKRGKGKKSSK